MNQITPTVQRELEETMEKIAGAAQQGRLDLVENLTRKASELKAIQDQLAAIERRVAALVGKPKMATMHQQEPIGLRELTIPVTQGMINQNLLTLTDAVSRRAIVVGEKLSIETPDGHYFDTVLLATGNKLQERGRIAKFYRESGVHAGDIVLLREITPGQWRIQKS